jgi:putative membrane protein
MKKLSFFMTIALAALSVQSCNRAKDSKATADSSNVAKDTAKTTAAAGSMAVDENDSRFATTAAADGMAEVNAGKIAQQKAVNPRVKSFAAMMVADHSKANDALASLAKAKNITLPAAPDADAQKKADELSKKSGKGFDKAYVAAMVEGHKKAVKLFTDASQNCKDPDLKTFAVNTLPTLKMHLDSIQAIHDSMK